MQNITKIFLSFIGNLFKVTLLSYPFVFVFVNLKKLKIERFFLYIFLYLAASRIISHDLLNYNLLYDNLETSMLLDSLFYFVAYFFKSIGFTFKMFFLTYLLISYELLLNIANNISEKFNLNRTSTFFIFINSLLFIEVFEQSTQFLRQFLSCLIILNIITNKRITAKKSIFYFLIASFTHSVALIYLPFIVQKFYSFKNLIIAMLLISISFLLIDLELIYSSSLYKTLALETIMLDKTEFGDNGIYFVGFGSLIILIMSFFISDLLKFSYEILIISAIVLALQFLPDQLYILKYRFILFCYLPVLLILLLAIGLIFKKSKKLNFIVLIMFTLVNSIRFFSQLGDIFEYSFSIENLILI